MLVGRWVGGIAGGLSVMFHHPCMDRIGSLEFIIYCPGETSESFGRINFVLSVAHAVVHTQ